MHLFSHHHLLCLSLVPYLPLSLSLLLFLTPDRIPLHLLFSLSFHPSAHTLSSSNLTDHPLSTSKTLELRSLPSANTLLEPLDRHQHQRMSSRRSRSRQSGSTRITDEQINELISKLQAVLPEARRGGNDRVWCETMCLISTVGLGGV